MHLHVRGVLALRSVACRSVAFVFLLAGLANADDWPRYGHDGALTGRSSLAGDIVEPRLAWSFSVAGSAATVAVLPGSGDAEARLELPPPAKAPVAELESSWGLGRGPETHHARWADLVPGVPGVEHVAWDNTWTTAPICRLQCFAHEPGKAEPRLLWQTDPPEANIFNPLNLVIDIDRDGVLEVLVAAHYRVMVFEGTTGRKESEIVYHQNRPYGWFGAFDVDADGQNELVTLGDFQSHLDVLEYDASKPEKERLSVLWRRDIESDISRREKWPQIGPRPVGDFTGDEKLEIALNLFNERGDGEWHLQVIDAASGAVIADVPRRCLQGTADVDLDGKLEVFSIASSGVVVPRFGAIEILRVDGANVKTIHAAADAAWGTADLPKLGESWSTTALDGMLQVLVAGAPTERPRWLEWRRSLPPEASSAMQATLSLAAMQLDGGGKAAQDWVVSGFPSNASVRAFVSDPLPRALVELRLPPAGGGTLAGRRVRLEVASSHPEPGVNAMPIAARLEQGKPPVVVVEAAGGRILAIEPPASGTGAARVRWTAAGRGMADGSRLCGLAAADLDGDGDREVLAADEHPSGAAQVLAYRADGAVRWRARFDQVPGDAPVWNRSGLTFFWPGRFRDRGRDDVLVSLRRGFMHSDVGVLLDGHTGTEVWRQASAVVPGELHWGYAGNVVAAADILEGPADEIVNLYPVCFWIADGTTGSIARARDLASRKAVPAWAAYGEPIVWDLTGDGSRDVILDSGYILALLDQDGAPVWHGPPRADYPSGKPEDGVGVTTDIKHALVDFDGDGALEIASAGYGDGVHAIDPRNGKVLWTLNAPRPTQPKVSAANLDGKPGDEMIYPAGDTLVAVTGGRESGRILWTWRGPAALSLPAIADTDTDGKAEIVVRSADGAVHCLDGPPAAGGKR